MKFGKMSNISSADCSDCDCGWTSTFDFTTSDYAGIWFVTRGEVWAAGIGWQSSHVSSTSQQQIFLQCNLSAVDLTSVKFFFHANGGSGANNSYGAFETPGGSGATISGLPVGDGVYSRFELAAAITFIGMFTNSGSTAEDQVISKAIIRGNGTRPAGWPTS